MNSPRKRYDRQGILAINPEAFFWMFSEPPQRENAVNGNATIISIDGPLTHHSDGWCDSYDDILCRVDEACASPAEVVVLKIDSPGGDAQGCLETARAIREKCSAAGKKLVAYVDGQACSAAYALACAASEIITSETGILGSIGVINCRIDVSAADKAFGTKFAIVASGARKADGHPHNPITEAELASTQRIVDSLANSFFMLVEDLRGMPVASVAALQAGIFHGFDAVAQGLANSVEPFNKMLARLAGAEVKMTTKYEEARAALEEAAKGDGDDAEKAKKALAAMDDESEAEPEEEPKDEAESEAEPEEEPKDEASKATVSAATAGALAADNNTLAARVAQLEKSNEATAKSAFLATRKDLSPGLVKTLMTKPLAEVKAIVNEIPKPKVPVRATTTVATRGEGQGDGKASRLAPSAKSALDQRMGLTAMKPGVQNTEFKLVLGASAPVEAAEKKGA